MNTEQIDKLVKELCAKKIKTKWYDGTSRDADLVEKEGKSILESIIREHILNSRDERIGILEAKVFFYEEMISKSTFAPMISKEVKASDLNKEDFIKE